MCLMVRLERQDGICIEDTEGAKIRVVSQACEPYFSFAGLENVQATESVGSLKDAIRYLDSSKREKHWTTFHPGPNEYRIDQTRRICMDLLRWIEQYKDVYPEARWRVD